jgi:hypothetical protein
MRSSPRLPPFKPMKTGRTAAKAGKPGGGGKKRTAAAAAGLMRCAAGAIFLVAALSCSGGDPASERHESRSAERSEREDTTVASDEESTTLNDQLGLYIKRLESVGLPLQPIEPEHEPGDLGATTNRAFEVEGRGIYLELLEFEDRDPLRAALQNLRATDWAGDRYWLGGSSGTVLLLARSSEADTREDRFTVQKLASAFAGEE